MSELREKNQADFDLERLFELMDEALTSKDERVQNALRGLLTIIELTRTQEDGKNAIETSHGPLRQMQEDLRNISRRLNNLENEIRQRPYPNDPPYPQPYNPGAGGPYPVGPWPYTTSKTSSSSSYTLTDNEKDSIMDSATIKITK